MKKFIKEHWFLIFLAFLATVLVTLKFLIYITPIPLQPSSVSQSNTWKEIVPQVSTSKDLQKILGQPIDIQKEKDLVVYFYPSETENWPTKIYVSETTQKVTLIKRFFPSPSETYQSFISQFGPPDKELFGPHQGAGFSVFVFLKKGVAIVANPNSGMILEIWYFSPTTLEDFLSSWGKDLTSTPPERF